MGAPPGGRHRSGNDDDDDDDDDDRACGSGGRVITLLLSLALQVGDPPPETPAEPVPRPVEEPDDDDDDEEEEEEEEDNDDDDDDDDDVRPRQRLPRSDNFHDDEATAVFWGASSGCAVGGVLPATGVAFGLGLFYGAGACGEVAGAIGGLSGALVAVPSLLLLGPCASGGATLGASVGAVLSAQDPLTAALWTLPGLGMGVAGGALATAGVLVTSTTDPELRTIAVPLGTTLVILGSIAALASGPVAVAGATVTQEPWGMVEGSSAELRDGGVEARHEVPSAVPTTMAF
ncbi:MAG: hypothetical protein Q8O67_33000 [Deltaproteobacteria bacterium]|nr:hypothetical protein [Deltaproteobacteria bacterium]